jgi:hypothetical protein
VFTTPPDSDIYVELILQRCRDLIESSVWQDLHVQRVSSWIGNFSDERDRYFAARILDGLIYRSPPQTKALIDYLFVRALPEVSRGLKDVSAPDDWVTPFVPSTPNSTTRFVPVIRDIDPPTKSGPLVARLVKRHLGISDNNIIWPFQIAKALNRGVKLFVFLDDFLGTGDQFLKFCRTNNIPSFFDSADFIYAPFVAHCAGIAAVKNVHPKIRIVCAELLDTTHQAFSPLCDCFSDGHNTCEDARKHYEDLIEKIGLRSSLGAKVWFGYGNLALTFSFSHASPNNSLPILWWRGDNFVPLFDR